MNKQKQFLRGKVPRNLDGFYKGELVEMFPKSFIEKLAHFVASFYLPWLGKTFFVKKQTGDNKLPFFPHAFTFKTYEAKSIEGNIKVLVLDYDLPGNPAVVRRVVDELVEIDKGYLLGKAYVKGKKPVKPRLLAYFGLRK